MSVEYETRPYLPGDEKQIAPLLISAFEKWPFFDIKCSAEEHWRWKYLNNPQHHNLLVEVLFENQIVASGHNILYDLLINGKKYTGSYGTDGCVHPKFQGRGLYRLLPNSMQRLKEKAGVKFHYMVTINPKIIRSSSQNKSTPHRFPYPVSFLTRIDDIDIHVKMKSLKKAGRRKIKHYLDKIRSSPIRSPSPSVQISQIQKFDHKMNSFLEQINAYYCFIKIRTPDYLNWRYLDHRAGNFEVRVVKEKGEIIGYSVFRINKLEEYHTGYVVDLLTLPDRLDVAEDLLLSGLNYFKENEVNVVSYQVIKNHPYESLFNRYGFYGGEGNRHIFYNYTGDDDLRLDKISPEKIHFPFGELTGI